MKIAGFSDGLNQTIHRNGHNFLINQALVKIQALRHKQHELITYNDEISVLALNIVDKEFKKIRFSADGDLQQRDTPSVR